MMPPFTVESLGDGTFVVVDEQQRRILTCCGKPKDGPVRYVPLPEEARAAADLAARCLAAGEPVPGWRIRYENCGEGYTIEDAEGRYIAHTSVHHAHGKLVLDKGEAMEIGRRLAGGVTS